MLVIKCKCHGINFNALVGLMFFYLRVTLINLTWKELSFQYIVASVSYTGSLGPSSRDTRGRVSPLGQPHLPVCQMNGVWGVAPVASGKGLGREIDQCSWAASNYHWSLLLLFPLPKPASSHRKMTNENTSISSGSIKLIEARSCTGGTGEHTNFSCDVSRYRKLNWDAALISSLLIISLTCHTWRRCYFMTLK